jgi:hypothetical protein
MDEPLIETWAIHNRINLYFLVAIPDEVFALPSTPIHRLVFQFLAHIHNIRFMWLQTAAPNLLEGLAKLEAKEGYRTDLGISLTASGKAIEELLRQGLAAGGEIKGFQYHATDFAGYLIRRESQSRRRIAWTLKDLGLWEWGVR